MLASYHSVITAASKSVKTTEQDGSQTMESMRQALRAQTAPSGQVVKTICVSLLWLILTNYIVILISLFFSIVNSIAIKCIVYPTSDVTFTELVAHVLKCLTCIKLNICSLPKVYSTSNVIHNANLLSSTILFVREGFPGKYNQFPEDSEACSTIHTTTIHVFD